MSRVKKLGILLPKDAGVAKKMPPSYCLLETQIQELQIKLQKYEPARTLSRPSKMQLFGRIKEKFDYDHPEQNREPPVDHENEFIYESVADISSVYSMYNLSIWEGHRGLTNSLRCSIETHLRYEIGVHYAGFCLFQSFTVLDASRAALIKAYMQNRWTFLSNKDEQEKILWKAIKQFICDL